MLKKLEDYKIKIDKIINDAEAAQKPLMIKEEYLKTVEVIFAIVKNESEKRQAELCELAEQMNAIAEEANENQKLANELLHRLQCDIYKRADMSELEKQEGKYINTEDLTPVYLWGKCAVNHFQYEEYKKNGGTN